MPDQKKADKPAPAAPAKEQNPLWWLLGFKETPEEKAAREAREQRDVRNRQVIDSAVKAGVMGPKGGAAKPQGK